MDIYIQGGQQKKYFSVFDQTNPDDFLLWTARIKIWFVVEIKEYAYNYTKSQSLGSSLLDQKMDPIQEKKIFFFF